MKSKLKNIKNKIKSEISKDFIITNCNEINFYLFSIIKNFKETGNFDGTYKIEPVGGYFPDHIERYVQITNNSIEIFKKQITLVA